MKLIKLAVTLLLIIIMGPVAALADASKLQVELQPKDVELPAQNQDVQVMVVLRNPSNETLSKLRLSFVNNPGIQIIPKTIELPELRNQGEYGAVLRLSQVSEEALADTVLVRLDYLRPCKSGTPGIPQVELATLKVKSRELPLTEKVADFQIQTTLVSLNEYRSSSLNLVIKNLIEVPVRLVQAIPNGPDFLTFDGRNQGLPISLNKKIPPYQLLVLPLKVEVKKGERFQPGKYMLLFQLDLEWEKGGRKHYRNSVAFKDVEVGVLGESEVLKVMGVPSFLVLPGFLIIVTASLLWQLGLLRREDETAEFRLKANNAEFWLVAVTLSGIMAFVSYLVGVNYLIGYNLMVIVEVWLASVFIGIVGYLLYIMAFRLYEKTYVFLKGDTFVTTLKKLHRLHLGLELNKVEAKIDGNPIKAFLLESRMEGRTYLWVAPAIKVIWNADASADLKEKFANLLEQGAAEGMATFLEQQKNAGSLSIVWAGLDKSKPEDVTLVGRKEKFIEIDEVH